MSRERPIPAPRAVPDGEDFKRADAALNAADARQRRAREQLEALKRVQGPGLLAAFFNPFNRPNMPAPKFIRRGYEANIVDELRDFFTWRPWRPKNRRSIKTRKEHLQILRRMEQAGRIRRVGGGRWELTKMRHA
jgi:hypothetical protein